MPEIVRLELDEDVFERKPRNVKLRGRRPEQQPYDDLVKEASDADKPLFLQVKPEEAEDVEKRVRSAAEHHKRGVITGEPRPGKEKGTVILSWKFRDPIKRGEFRDIVCQSCSKTFRTRASDKTLADMGHKCKECRKASE